MNPAQERRLNGDLAEAIQSGLGLSVDEGIFTRPSGRREFLMGLKGLVAGREQAARVAAAHRLARDSFDDDDPIRQAYPGESGGAYAEPLDEGGGVHVEDDDDDWQDGEDAAAASVDKFFPPKRKPADAPQATKASDAKGVGVAAKGSPLARLLRTDGDGGGDRDHEPAERKPRTALSRFLDRRRK